MRKNKIFFARIVGLLLIFVIALWALALAQDEDEYHLSVGDLVEITVYDELDLTKVVRVSADGNISYPLLGNIYVVGLTAKELQSNITELLAKDYLVNPQVAVFIKEHSKVSVLGQVKNPGAYELKSSLTVIGAIALAGGFTERANTALIKLVRRGNEGKQEFIINVQEITEKGYRKKDMVLMPNDLIMVEELGAVSIVGQVRNPGKYFLKAGMTLVEAIAQAGGFSDSANTTNVKLIRMVGNEKQTINVNVSDITEKGEKEKDVLLRQDDLIIVEQYGSVSVVGQVKNAGKYGLKKGMTVIDAIALAGGFTDIAAANGTKVIRVIGGKKKIINIPVGSILRGGDKSRDIPLEPNDTIVVPESFF